MNSQQFIVNTAEKKMVKTYCNNNKSESNFCLIFGLLKRRVWDKNLGTGRNMEGRSEGVRKKDKAVSMC